MNRVKIYNDVYQSCLNTSAVAVLTEWDEFKNLDWSLIQSKMKDSYLIIDGRFIIPRNKLPKQLNLISI